jgi:hypothetical protein
MLNYYGCSHDIIVNFKSWLELFQYGWIWNSSYARGDVKDNNKTNELY